jgi:hypothetical protein
MRKLVSNAVVAAVLVGCGVVPIAAPVGARTGTGAGAHAPIFLVGTIQATILSSKTTATVKFKGVTLITQDNAVAFTGVLTGTVHEMNYINIYPDGAVLGGGTDVCVCTARGLSGTTTDQYTFGDNGTTLTAPGTFGPGTGGFAGLNGTGYAIQADKDPNHFKIIMSAQVP